MPTMACADFATVEDVLARETCTLDESDSDLIEDAIGVASDVLYTLSGGRVTGICTVTLRPVSNGLCGASAADDYWFSLYGVDAIPLSDDLISVDLVKIDGVDLSTSDYGLLDGRMLYRRGDETFWPRSNNLKLDDTEVGTFSITQSFGTPPDWLAIGATVDIALQLITDNQRRPGYLRGVNSASVAGAQVTIDREAARVASLGLPMLERFLGVYVPTKGRPVGVWAPEMDMGWTLVVVEGPSGS